MSTFFFQPTPHEEAVEFIASKPLVSRQVFAKLLPELKARAFTVAGIDRADTLQRLRETVAELPAGGDWRTLKGRLLEDLSPYVVTSDDPETRAKQEAGAARHAELLLRTHGQQAYSAAGYRLMDAQRDLFPRWQYQTLGDSRVRHSHAALDGIVLPQDSPFWQTHFPPWDWGCRCQAIPLSEEDVEEIRFQDAKRLPEARQIIEGQDLQRLEQQHLLVRHLDPVGKKGAPTPINVQSPAEAGKEGAFRWHPGDLRLSLEDLRGRYDAQTFGEWEAWAKKTPIPAQKQTVWEWLSGAILQPDAPVTLPQGSVITFQDLLGNLGLARKVQWTEADVQAILVGLKKPGALKAANKVTSLTGAPKKGHLSAKAILREVRNVLQLLPPQLARELPSFAIEVRSTLPGAAGQYNNRTQTLSLSLSALTDPDFARRTIWHELMHWIHLDGPDRVPAFRAYRKAMADHFAARTAGEREVQLPRYRHGIRGKLDKWWDAYVGRIYPGLGATGTEVPTRYFELFAHPAAFLRQMDPFSNPFAAHFLETVDVVMRIFLEP